MISVTPAYMSFNETAIIDFGANTSAAQIGQLSAYLTDNAITGNARAGVNTENNRHAIPPARRRLAAPLQGRRHLIRDLTVMVDFLNIVTVFQHIDQT